MASTSRIEWTDATWQPITGCSIVSPGCRECYAMKLAGTRLRHHPSRAGLTVESKAGSVWTGEVRFNVEWLMQPLQWKQPRRIFVCAHGDLFHESVPDAWIDQVFAVMALARQHTFQVLTKRADRMKAYLSNERRPYIIARSLLDLMLAGKLPKRAVTDESWPIESEGDIDFPDDVKLGVWPLTNVLLGVSAERQVEADERVPLLLETPAVLRFVSAEPLLGPIDLTALSLKGVLSPFDALSHGATYTPDAIINGRKTDRRFYHFSGNPTLDWVIAGGESGSNARPMHPDWARSLRDQCAAAGVPFFFKQWGEYREFDNGKPGVEVIVADAEEAAAFVSLAVRPSWITVGGRHFLSIDTLPDDVPCRLIERVGKSAAGHRLDGIEHLAMPGVR